MNSICSIGYCLKDIIGLLTIILDRGAMTVLC